MGRHAILALEAHCPWASWARPNLRWCEAMQCGWIVTPINAWTNLAYLLVALLVWVRLKPSSHPLLRAFPPAIVGVGVTSFAYHASYTFWMQVGDFLGMFVFLGVALEASLRGRFPNALNKRYPMYSVAFLAVLASLSSTASFVLLGLPYQGLVFAQIVLLVVVEASGSSSLSSHLQIALACMVGAAACSLADQFDVVCHPHSLFQGHGIWHILSSAALFFLFKHYERIKL